METKQATHTATRCKECKWIYTADTENQSSNYMGVEFCPTHNRAVNSHEELVSLLKEVLQYGKTETGWQTYFAVVRKALKKVEGK